MINKSAEHYWKEIKDVSLIISSLIIFYHRVEARFNNCKRWIHCWWKCQVLRSYNNWFLFYGHFLIIFFKLICSEMFVTEHLVLTLKKKRKRETEKDNASMHVQHFFSMRNIFILTDKRLSKYRKNKTNCFFNEF